MLIRTNRLADEFYLLAHDDFTGRPLLPNRVAGLGSAAALLGELLLDGHIDIRGCDVVCLSGARPIGPLADATLAAIEQDGQLHPVRAWLAFFGQSAVENIALRLSSEGLLTRRTSRIPLRQGCWAPTEPNLAAVVSASLVTRLVRREHPDDRTVVLAGLARVTGLERDHSALWEVRDRPEAKSYLDSVLADLPPPQCDLIRNAEAAIVAAIVTHRA